MYNTLENLLSDHHTIDLVLGDFNIDILNSTNINLQNLLSNYTLLVNQATHISGSLLDHAYVNNKTLRKFSIHKTKIVGIYFSDHDAMTFKF